MKDYVILTDSCIDLPAQLAEKLDLLVLPLKVSFEGKEFSNYLDEREIKIVDFYNTLRSHIKTSTAQATPHEFEELMKEAIISNKDVLSISFSSALSGTFNSSLIAKNLLSEEYPEAIIECIDSMSASMGQGLLLYYAAKLKQAGKSLSEVKEFVINERQNISHLFTVDDLGHLRRGGRLSASKEFIGNLLNVKPLLHVSSEGKLVVYGKARGRIKSLHSLANRLFDTIDKSKQQYIFISHGDSLDDALFLKELVKNKIAIDDDHFVINPIGPVIGSHSGVGTIAIFYLGNERITE